MSPSGRTFWRRRTGFVGFVVEASMWLSCLTLALNVVAWLLGLVVDA